MPSVDDFLVDFSKEESGGGQAHYPPKTYLVRVAGSKTGISEDKGTPYLEVIFAFKEGRLAKGKKKMSDRLYNTPKAMRRFRLLLQAVGVAVPKKLDLTKLGPKIKGKELYIELEDDEREGYSTRSRVAFEGFMNVDDYDAEGDEDEDEDLEEEEDEDLEEDEEEDDEDEDEDEEDEEEEEEEPPKRRRRSTAKRTPAKKRSSTKTRSKKRRSRDEDEDEDLEDLDLDSM